MGTGETADELARVRAEMERLGEPEHKTIGPPLAHGHAYHPDVGICVRCRALPSRCRWHVLAAREQELLAIAAMPPRPA